MSTEFYAALPIFADFREACLFERYSRLPDDWHIVMSDVRNSTSAVEHGSYKQINTVGAATISAVLNATGTRDIPFIFEGDGAMLCMPPEMLDDAQGALLQTQDMARTSFDLDLRIATLPVAQIRAAGHDILIARYRVSEHHALPVFAGGGMEYASCYMKDPATEALCAVRPGSTRPRGNFDGLECRWQDIPSRHGETVSLVVKALDDDPARATTIYQGVIGKVQAIYGSDAACNPIAPADLTIALDAGQLGHEVKVRADGRSWRYLLRLRLIVLLGWFLMKFGVRTKHTDWGQYKETLVRNTDAKKFNDVYRQILSGNATQRAALIGWLEEQCARRELAYGLHTANRAHMTCLVFDYSGHHLHFIDGADGGMFLAAKALKDCLKKIR